MAEGMKDLEKRFVFMTGAIKQRPEGIKVNSEDRMWSRWENIPLAFWAATTKNTSLFAGL